MKTSANSLVCSSGARTGSKPVFADVLENSLAAPEQKAIKIKMADIEKRIVTEK